MKMLYVPLLLLLSAGSAYSTPLSKAEINAKCRDFMTRVQEALVQLSKTTPNLQGIESVQIQGPDMQYRGKEVYQVMEFTKNVRTTNMTSSTISQPQYTITSTSLVNLKPVAPASSIMVIEPNGIDLYIAMMDRWPHREITKYFLSSNDADAIKFYYFIGTCPKDSKTTTDAEKAAIEVVLNSLGREFVAMFNSPVK